MKAGEKASRGSVAPTQPPIEFLPMLREERLGGDPEHVLFNERAGGCGYFIARRIECTSDVGQCARIRGLAKHSRPIDKGTPAVLFDQLSRDCARVRVNLVAPGAIDTPFDIAIFPRDARPDVPLGRMGQPREVAEVVRFRLSPASVYDTGATWRGDGSALAGAARARSASRSRRFICFDDGFIFANNLRNKPIFAVNGGD